MSFQQAEKIATELLEIFQQLFKQRETFVCLSLFDKSSYKSDILPDIIYKTIRDNRHFELTFWDDPDDLGYSSILPDYDPSTYVLCYIIEKRSNGEKKYEMTFGFDIEKRTFLELFELVHYNTVGILREYPDMNSELESQLKNIVIIN